MDSGSGSETEVSADRRDTGIILHFVVRLSLTPRLAKRKGIYEYLKKVFVAFHHVRQLPVDRITAMRNEESVGLRKMAVAEKPVMG